MFRKLLVLQRSLCAAIILVVAISPQTLTAQPHYQSASQPVAGEHDPNTASHATPGAAFIAGPRISPVAFHTLSAKTGFFVAVPEGPHGGLGKNLALVGVGAVAAFAGSRIGGTAGGVIVVGGVALAIYGLYHFLR
ncbi:MAG: hypothetical protein ACR2MQ_08305 [Gemmatimonadaceae bacterium]